MVRVSHQEIERAEQIVENSGFATIWQEYMLYKDSIPVDERVVGENNNIYYTPEQYEKMGDYYKQLNRAMRVGIYPTWKQQCPKIKWIRKFAEEYSRRIPENTKTYQKWPNPLFIEDPE
jgi:hypothetical protein